MSDVITDIYGRPGKFWGNHTEFVGPNRPPNWLCRAVGWGFAHDLAGMLAAVRMFAKRRHARGVVTDGGASGMFFAWLQALVPWGKKNHVMVDCNWYESPSRWRTWLKGVRLRLAARSVDRFVVWARHEIEDYARVFGLPADKLEYVPFHITLTDYEYEIRDDGYLFAGGNYDRDYPMLIDAVRPLDLPTWIATTRPEQLDGVDIPPHVRVEGTSMAGFRQAMAAARLVVVPMQGGLLHSGGQQTLLNAMYMRKPTIAVGRKWALDFVTDGEDGLIVDYGDQAGLERAIRWILDHPEAAQAMGERAHERAAYFTTERTMRAVHALATASRTEPPVQAGSSWRLESGIQSRPRLLFAARWPVGGIRTHLKYNLPTLLAAGYEVTLVVPDDESLPAVQQAFPESRIVPVPVNGRSCSLWRTLRPLLASGRFDLVHAHGLTAAAHASLASVGKGIPLVVTLHEPLREAQFRGARGKLKRWLLGKALARARNIITVSEDSRTNLLQHFANLRSLAERIQAISNGIDVTPTADFANGSLRDDLGLEEDTFLLGFLGRFMPEKGFPLLLEALARLKRSSGVPPFHLVAFGSWDYRREYTRRLEDLGLQGVVTLHDFVPDVRPFLEQLDLVVVPSLWEASSLVSMEAMCAGVPVLGSDCPGLREVLAGTPSRTVHTGVLSALVMGLRDALANPWFDQAAAYAPLARNRFDNRRSALRLLELYERLGIRGTLIPDVTPQYSTLDAVLQH